ncbi:MAG TPA: tetratricopeptide repeat protein [Nitrospirales bacterium]|nr:tetratricopeptide repeat protein [Nitrospirales bacterium]
MSYRIKTPSKPTVVGDAQLLSSMERLSFAFEQHRLFVLAGVAVVILAAAILGGVAWYDTLTAERANELHYQAMKVYFDRPADQPAKTDANLKRSVELLTQLVDQYPRTPVARIALFELGNALVQGNELDGGIAVYTRYLASYPDNKQMLAMVYQRLGYAYLLKGQADQAGKAFAAVLDIDGALNKDHALFELAKLEEAQSRPEGAAARYQELTKNYPNSPFAGEGAVRLKALEAKKTPTEMAPAPVAPSPVAPGTPGPPTPSR